MVLRFVPAVLLVLIRGSLGENVTGTVKQLLWFGVETLPMLDMDVVGPGVFITDLDAPCPVKGSEAMEDSEVVARKGVLGASGVSER
jgi:hypothetical protein